MDQLTMPCPVLDCGPDCWACEGKGRVRFTGEAAERAGATLARVDRWVERRRQEPEL
ncbi:hypothetical protein [Streptomyces synnematoformans]|uniref:Uncharacterized protein n=1 Tax=Streptomyces synnematoformans TaxID=415721 RepID=A0ABN2XF14_9ACTN